MYMVVGFIWLASNDLDWPKNTSFLQLGQTRLIYCFSDPHVHWLFQKVRKKSEKQKINFKNWPFLLQILHFYALFCLAFLLFYQYSFQPSEMDQRNNTTFKSDLKVVFQGLTCTFSCPLQSPVSSRSTYGRDGILMNSFQSSESVLTQTNNNQYHAGMGVV